MRCSVCNGATTCPGNRYLRVRPPLPEEVIFLPPDQDPGEEWVATHTTKRTRTWVRKKGLDGMHLVLVGSLQSRRIQAHYGVEGKWVGMCTYAFYIHPNPEAYPQGYPESV